MTVEKTCQEYLSENHDAMDEIEPRQRKRSHRFHIVLLIWLVLIVISFAGAWVISGSRIERDRADLHAAMQAQQLPERMGLLADMDVLANYQATRDYSDILLGNQSGRLMMDGIAYQDDQRMIYMEDHQCIMVTVDEKQSLFPNAISYLNLHGDDLFFRDDVDRQIKCFHLSTKEMETISLSHSSEVLYYRDTLYFISLDDNRSLNILDLAERTTKKIVDEPVLRFCIMGERIYSLSETGILSCYPITNLGKQLFQIEHVENFSMTDRLFVENNGRILTLQLDGSRAKEIIPQADQLIGADGQCVFYACGNDLMVYHLDSKDSYCLADGFTVCLGAYELVKDRYLLSLIRPGDTQQIETQVVEVPHAN